jgi:predicted enzyme related to lactoylglutathione lyase
MMGPEDVPDGPSIAMFTDPEGHLVGLIKADSLL